MQPRRPTSFERRHFCCWACSLATLIGALAVPTRVWAEHLTIEFDTLGEAAPAHLCVRAPFLAGKATEVWQEGQTCAGILPAEWERGADGCFLSPEPTKGNEPPFFVRCTPKSSPSESQPIADDARVVVLEVRDVGVDTVVLAGNTARITFNTATRALVKGKTPTVSVRGGHYHDQEAVAFPLNGQNQWTKMTLRPRCVQRQVALPQYHCGEQATAPERKVDVAYSTAPRNRVCQLNGPGAVDTCTIRLEKTGPTEVEATDCGHKFGARLEPPLPPERIELEVENFWFRWAPNCLSPRNSCPAPRWPAADISCGETSPSPECPKERPDCKPEEKVCMYNACHGAARFPTQVRLEPAGSATQQWDEILGSPGQVLHGFTPPDQRRVTLHWTWPDKKIGEIPQKIEKDSKGSEACKKCKQSVPDASSYLSDNDNPRCRDCSAALREEKTRLPGNEIDYLEVRTPEGRVHHVGVVTNQIRVPELECEDRLTLTYHGRLAYVPSYEKFEPDKGVIVPAPEEKRRDKMLFGISVGGGARRLWHPSNQWGPQGEVEGIGVVTPTGYSLGPGWGTIKMEIRGGAILTDHPYCYGFSTSADASSKKCEALELRPTWFFFGEFGTTVYSGDKWPMVGTKWSIGVSLGGGRSYYFLQRDSNKVPVRWLFTARLAVGYELIRGITAVAQLRVLWPDPTFATTFDEAGMSSYGNDGRKRPTTITFGPMLRFDNVF